ncbi:MAG: hypothetical protein ABEJ31_10490 [Haloarculaceae archaeon]
MNYRRLAFGAAGLALLGLALTATGDGVFGRLRTAAVAALGNDYYLVAGIGAVALLVAVPVLLSGRAGNLDRTEMPDPERPIVASVDGREFDRTVHGWRFRLPLVGRPARERVRTRLRSAAVETVAAADGCRRSEAERRVADGEWTANPAAGAFLAADRPMTPASVRLRAWLGGEATPERCAVETAAEIAAYAGGDR